MDITWKVAMKRLRRVKPSKPKRMCFSNSFAEFRFIPSSVVAIISNAPAVKISMYCMIENQPFLPSLTNIRMK